MTASVLTINGGSSSIQFALHVLGDLPQPPVSGKVERIGVGDAVLSVQGEDEKPTARRPIDAPGHEHALVGLLEELEKRVGLLEWSTAARPHYVSVTARAAARPVGAFRQG